MENTDDVGIRCNEHPDAPHSFMRDASHSAGRYVCECEFWELPKEKQKPVAYITGFHNGHCVIEPLDRATVLPVGMALYRAPTEWVGLTDEEVMVAAYQAGFDIHEDYDNEDDPKKLHWWSADGEACNDSLLKLRDFIEAKLKEKNGG